MKIVLIAILFLICLSCHSANDINGKYFLYGNPERTINYIELRKDSTFSLYATPEWYIKIKLRSGIDRENSKFHIWCGRYVIAGNVLTLNGIDSIEERGSCSETFRIKHDTLQYICLFCTYDNGQLLDNYEFLTDREYPYYTKVKD